MTDYAAIPDDAVLDHEQPAQDSAPQPVAVKQANGRWLLDPGAIVASDAPKDGTGAGQGDGSGLMPLPADAQLDAPKIEAPTTLMGNIGLGTRDVLGSIGQGLNFLQTPTAAVWSALGGHPQDYEKAADDFADKLGLPRVPTDGHIGSAFRRGLGLGVLTAGAAAPLAEAGGATGAVAKSLSATPIADAISTGTSEGAGELAKENGAGATGQLLASIAGGGLGAVGSTAVPAIVKRITQSTDPNAILAAFQRQNAANLDQGAAPLQPMAANVGGFGSKMFTAGAKATLGGLPLSAAAERIMAGAQAMRNRIAGTIGNATDDVGAGQAAIKGANNFIDTTAARGGKLYDAIPIAGTRQATLTNTRSALADLNAGLESNPELSKLLQDGRLKAYEDALTPKTVMVDQHVVGGGKAQPVPVQQGGQLSWQDLKRFRSYIGELAGRQTLQDNTSKDALQKLYGALSQDMRNTAASDSPKALQAFERANTYWRARQSRIDDTLSMIVGNDQSNNPEKAFAQIQRWARDGGNFAAVGRTLRSLSPDEADQVRASIFARLGNAPTRGQGDEAIFSPSYFLKHWSGLDDRAKAVLFPGEKYRQDLTDIANISKSLVASEAFTNTSRTALATHIGGNLLGAGALALISHPLAIGSEAVGYGAGHLLANPRFAAWLASSVRKPAGPAALAHIGRLTSIAAAEPQIANEVLALQQRLAATFTNAPMKAAAQPDNRNRQ